MNRQRLIKLIDGLSFAGFVLLAATGFVLHFVLPPGSGRLVGEGTGFRAAQRPVALLWGMTGHQWGDLHYWIAVGFMAILAVHLLLHWRFLICLVKGLPTEESPIRAGLGIVGLLFLFGLAMAPFLSPKVTVPRSQLQGDGVVKEYKEGRSKGKEPCNDAGAAPCSENP